MATTKGGGAIRLDANDTLDGPIRIKAIKYVAGTGSPSCTIQDRQTDNAGVTTTGSTIWSTAATTNEFDHADGGLTSSSDGVVVTLTGTGTIVYLYV